MGSPFSAAYAMNRAESPLRFCAMNVAVYGPRATRFSLTEHAIAPLDRGREGIVIGASTMRRDPGEGGALVVRIDERSAPWGAPVRGTIRLVPESAPGPPHTLDEAGRHRWWPIAPVARIEVALDAPALRFTGHGYYDANAGDVPLETSFARWSWSRARLEGGRAAILYDTVDRAGAERQIARIIDARGDARSLAVSDRKRLPKTRWGLERTTRAHGPTRALRTLEDGPFYARTLLSTEIAGERVLAMHEELSCVRLARAWSRFLTGFRMRRA